MKGNWRSSRRGIGIDSPIAPMSDFVGVWIAGNLEYFGTMEFRSKIFVRVKNPGARIADLGGMLVYGSFVLIAILKVLKAPPGYMLGGFCLTVAAIIMVFIGRKIAKGNMFEIGLADTELVVAEDGVRIGEEYYPLDQITDLDFWIEG